MSKPIKIADDTHRKLKKFIHKQYLKNEKQLTMTGVIKFCVDKFMADYVDEKGRDDEINYLRGWQRGVKTRMATGLPVNAAFLRDLEKGLK